MLKFCVSCHVTNLTEPRKRAHSPQLDFDELSRVAAGLASVSENGKLPYGRRFPAACCRGLQLWVRTVARTGHAKP